jgi:hypothetical protein
MFNPITLFNRRHIGIDEMLKEIRAALRKCFDHKLPEQ